MGPTVITMEGGENFDVLGDATLGLDDAAFVAVIVGIKTGNINELRSSCWECRGAA